ncbi:hypothetical protein [Burkholderia sp. Ac-20365]|uniref:hypothetical protein n=1 Tax=Burkholderia sp. Ac-20365 TaxID=2703897 RepID=UPI00197B32BD|nr:hypothetical protein [Burkholderia sp. Ac-20365]MBN3761257.1 hypothetical protein [Burkholderia sp. Ac-20365]
MENFEQRSSGKVKRALPFVASILMAGALLAGWEQYKEAGRLRAAANADVEAHISLYLPQVFSEWSERVPGVRLLEPDTVFSGSNSVIVAVQPESRSQPFRDDRKLWHVLAKSRSGTYISLTYELCDDCEADKDKLKANRIFLGSPTSVLSIDQAKDWLYRANMRALYKSEFGVEAPPATVQG